MQLICYSCHTVKLHRQRGSIQTLQTHRSSGVRPFVGRTICHLLLFMSERTMCCPQQLFVTLEFSSTAMSLCGPMCRVRCPDVLLCYDSSTASDAQCPMLCSIRWSCRWLCHVSTTATHHSQDFLRLSSVDFSRFSMPPPDWCIDLLGMSMSHQYCETYTGCGLRNALIQVSCAHLLMPARPGATVSFRLHPERHSFQPSPSPIVVILTASDPTYTAVHCWWSCISGCRFWNGLPPHVTSVSTLSVFRNRLKTYLFSGSFPSCFWFLVLHTVYSSGLAVFVL